MKIIKLSKDYFKGIIENVRDLWILSLILEEGDVVKGKSKRKIKKENKEEVKYFFAVIEVEKVKFEEDKLRVIGRLLNEVRDIAKGSYHSLTFTFSSTIEIEKKFEDWQLKKLRSLEKKSKILAISFDEEVAIFAELNGKVKELFTIYNKFGKREIANNQSLLNSFIKEIVEKVKSLNEKNKYDKIIVASINFYNEIVKKFLNLENVVYVKINDAINGIREIERFHLIRIKKDSEIALWSEKINKALEELSKNGNVCFGINPFLKNAKIGNVKEVLVIDEALLNKDLSKEIFNLSRKFNFPIIIVNKESEAGKILKNFKIIAFTRYKIE